MYFSAAFITSAVLYWIYYRFHYGKKPYLYWKQDSKWSKFLSDYVPSIESKYWSFYFIPGGKFQTICAAILPKKHSVLYNRKVINTPDGSQFLLAWVNEEDLPETNRPIVFIYPGLVSTTASNYVNELVSSIVDRNYAVALLVNRGLETPCLTAKTYCATHTMDLDQAISFIKQRHPQSPLVAIGISLGGLVLTRYLSLTGHNSKLLAAFIYSCPFNPVLCSASLEKWDNWLLYNATLTKDLKRIYHRSKDQFAGIVDHEKLMDAKSIRKIDQHFTAKVFGYESVDHYYEDAVITENMIQSIKTPTLCLNANDDAFAPEESLPRDAVCVSDFVAMAVTSGGGHVSHLCGANPFSTPYYINMFLDYAAGVLEHEEELLNCSS